MERLSISISSHMKRQLEVIAKANFRNLNGEINKALDDYIRKNGVGVVEDAPKEQIGQPQKLPNAPTKHQQESMVHQNAPIITTLHTSDEIEEF